MTKYIVWTLQNNLGLWPICERSLRSLHKFKMLSYGFASAQHLGFSTSLRSVKNSAKSPRSFFRVLTIIYCHYYPLSFHLHHYFDKHIFQSICPPSICESKNVTNKSCHICFSDETSLKYFQPSSVSQELQFLETMNYFRFKKQKKITSTKLLKTRTSILLKY